jgi:trimeric autotransporter adhesin
VEVFVKSGLGFSISRVSTTKIFNAVLGTLFLIAAAATGSAQQAPNTISTIAGGGAIPSSPLQADLPGPTAVLKDGQGNLYISAPASAYVFELPAGGTLQAYAGQGWGYYSGDGGPLSAATVGLVTDVAEDALGNFYIVDIADSRIREVTPSGIINTVVGNGTKCDIATGTDVCGDGGPVIDAELNIPTSIALDSAGNIYITDTDDNRIRVANMGSSAITIAGTSIPAGDIQTIVGDGNACPITSSTCGDGGPASAAEVNGPKGIFVDAAGDIYIADTGDNEIRVIMGATSGGATITDYAGQMHATCPQSTSGCNDGSPANKALLRQPQGIFLDSFGNGYISDTGNNKLRYVNAQTGTINTMAGTGAQGFSGDTGPAQQAELDSPNSLFVDSSSNIYVADTGNQRVREFQLGGTIQTIAGSTLGTESALSAQLANPYAVVEAAGTIYFTDQANNLVRKLTNNGGVYTVSTVAGTGSAGFGGDGGPATSALMGAPTGLALDNLGNLYFTDTNNLVVRQVNLSTGIIKTVAGTPGVGCPPPTNCGNNVLATSASFTYPLGIATDSNGNLYIADYFGYRIFAVNMGSTTTKLAGIGGVKPGYMVAIAGTGIQGDCTFSNTCGKSAIKTAINHPGDPAVDSSGNVYFTDQWNDAVRIVTTSNVLNAYALGGHPSVNGDGGPALKSGMWNPLMVTLDPEGNLYISGGNDELVQRVDVSTTSLGGPHEIGTVAGNINDPTLGGFAGDGGSATARSVRINNVGSSVDALGNLYIADAGNNRIRYVPLGPEGASSVSTINLGTWPIGQSGGGLPVNFTSTGGAELSLNSISITGADASEFTATNTCGSFPVSMGPDAHCTVTVSLTPTGYGPQSATLTFSDNAPDSPQSVTLTGSGPTFSSSVSPNAIKVNQGNSGTSTITLTPVAQFNQTVNLTCSGNPADSTCTISPNQITLTGSSTSTATLTIQTQSDTPTGSYTLVVTSTFENIVQTSNITFRVNK